MYRYVILTTLSFLLVSCNYTQKEKEPLIEFYLLKDRVKLNQGNKVNKIVSSDLTNELTLNDSIYFEFARFDETLNQEIFAGTFDVEIINLENTPLVKDEEIIGLNFDTNELKLNKEAYKRINNIKPDLTWSTQFVITANKNPILTGYLYSKYSSSWVHDYYIITDYKENKKENQNLIIRHYITPTEYDIDNLPDLTENIEFYKAFKEANKIIK